MCTTPDSGGWLGKQHRTYCHCKKVPSVLSWVSQNLLCIRELPDSTAGTYVQFYEFTRGYFPICVKKDRNYNLKHLTKQRQTHTSFIWKRFHEPKSCHYDYFFFLNSEDVIQRHSITIQQPLFFFWGKCEKVSALQIYLWQPKIKFSSK